MRFPVQRDIYSFHRQFGTTIESALDLETAQKAVNHDIGFRTFRKHYDRGLDHSGVTDFLTGTGGGQMAGESANISLSLRRVDGHDSEDAARAALDKLHEILEWLALIEDRHSTSAQKLALPPTGAEADEARANFDRDLANINGHLHNMMEAATKQARATSWKDTSAELTVAAIAARKESAQQPSLSSLLKRLECCGALPASDDHIDTDVGSEEQLGIKDVQRWLALLRSTEDRATARLAPRGKAKFRKPAERVRVAITVSQSRRWSR